MGAAVFFFLSVFDIVALHDTVIKPWLIFVVGISWYSFCSCVDDRTNQPFTFGMYC